MSRKNTSGSLGLPGAIIIAGAMIAVALIWINRPAAPGNTTNNPGGSGADKPASAGIAPVNASDHILGNPNAPVKLIEYSDLSCPYCKQFNPTLEQVMNTYGPTGKVAWIYRQFPLYRPVNDVIPHPNSLIQAEALECAGALGGNTAFFAFEKEWFNIFPDEGAGRTASVDRDEIASVGHDVGLDAVSFNECLSDGRFKDKIAKAYDDGLAAGITGTPFMIIVTPSGNQIPLVGGQSYNVLKSTIDTLITTIPATTTPTY